MRRIKAGMLYFTIVLGAGFMLGLVRVPFIVPRLGERYAELAEMPIMGVTIFYAAGFVLRRFPAIHPPRRALAMGFLALALSVAAELGLAAALQSRTLVEYVASRDRISGSVYLAMLVVFAVMPRLRLSRHEPA